MPRGKRQAGKPPSEVELFFRNLAKSHALYRKEPFAKTFMNCGNNKGWNPAPVSTKMGKDTRRKLRDQRDRLTALCGLWPVLRNNDLDDTLDDGTPVRTVVNDWIKDVTDFTPTGMFRGLVSWVRLDRNAYMKALGVDTEILVTVSGGATVSGKGSTVLHHIPASSTSAYGVNMISYSRPHRDELRKWMRPYATLKEVERDVKSDKSARARAAFAALILAVKFAPSGGVDDDTAVAVGGGSSVVNALCMAVVLGACGDSGGCDNFKTGTRVSTVSYAD
jgi:hypothetical protein